MSWYCPECGWARGTAEPPCPSCGSMRPGEKEPPAAAVVHLDQIDVLHSLEALDRLPRPESQRKH